jgi:tRNA (mo5U34)-methyltransferase
MTTTSSALDDLRAQVLANRVWYHTMELAPGVVTAGWFDLRPIVDRMPWPEVRDKRCLDIGTYDGFLAFEMERRGAREVVAVDIGDHTLWDWPPDMRALGGQGLAKLAGEKGAGFAIAAAALGSRVQKVEMSIYELSPERLGQFDVICCGSLLLHLRDPLKALEAVRSVCAGVFLSAETIDLKLSVLHPRIPVARLNGMGSTCQWWIPSVAGHRRMIMSAGFEILAATRPYAIPHGAAHPRTRMRPRRLVTLIGRTLIAGGSGAPHAAVLAKPNV